MASSSMRRCSAFREALSWARVLASASSRVRRFVWISRSSAVNAGRFSFGRARLGLLKLDVLALESACHFLTILNPNVRARLQATVLIVPRVCSAAFFA